MKINPKDIIRKTISFKGHIVDEINYRRGKALIDDSEDINFSEMVNILLEKLFEMGKNMLEAKK